jgi:hypothetical protein
MSRIFWATISTVTVTKATQRAVRYRERCSPTYRDSIQAQETIDRGIEDPSFPGRGAEVYQR